MIVPPPSETNGAVKARRSRIPTRQRFDPGRPAGAKSRRNIVSGNIYLGDTGQRVGDAQSRMDPDSADSSVYIDTDIMVTSAGNGSNTLLLTSGGNIEGILANLDRFPLTSGDPLFKKITSFSGARGVGKMRLMATLLLAHQLTEILPWLRSWLVKNLARFSGPESPKLLVVNIVFSLCGGTGSALAIPIAMLVREIVRTLDPTLQVSVEAHVVTPVCFAGKVVTPSELDRNNANGAATILEMRWFQNPRNMAELSEALGVALLRRPLFDKVRVQDIVDGASCSQSLAQIHERIASNLIASDDQGLLGNEGAHAINTEWARNGDGDDQGAQAVIESCRSVMARLPVERLAQAFAARGLVRELIASTRRVDKQRLQELVSGSRAILELKQFTGRVFGALTPNFAVPAVKGLSDGDLRRVAERKGSWWEERGRHELHEERRRLGRDLPREARQKAGECVRSLQEASRGVPELVVGLRDIQESVNDELNRVRKERERIAAVDGAAIQRQALESLQQLGRLSRRRRRTREMVRASLIGWVKSEVDLAALSTLQEQVLLPMLSVVKEALTDAERLEHALDLKRSEMELQSSRLESTIGFESESHSHIIRPEEVDGFLEQVASDLPARVGPLPRLALSSLLETSDEEGLRTLLASTAAELMELFVAYLENHVGDLAGLVGRFRLSFDPERWLTERVEGLTLPSRLNTSTHGGPGNYPLQAYLMVAPTFQSQAEAILERARPTARYQVVPGSSPFAMVLRLKVSGLTWAALPSLPDLDAALRSYRSAGGDDPGVWRILSICSATREALDEPLIPDPGRRPVHEQVD